MIPKTIHFCWFGKGEKPRLANKCIESWKKYCPDYKIIEWNEDNFDINSNQYVREAYDAKKYAFVTDYVRLYALYTEGGIYMDTDVEVIRSLDRYLSDRGFSGFELIDKVSTGIMASEKGLPIIGELLSDYDGKRFILPDGSYNMTTNCIYITDTMKKYGLKLNGKKQTVSDFTFYPPEVFCPIESATGIMRKTSETATIHWFNQSWNSIPHKLLTPFSRAFRRVFGINSLNWLKR